MILKNNGFGYNLCTMCLIGSKIGVRLDIDKDFKWVENVKAVGQR